jgi:hypothetical protein
MITRDAVSQALLAYLNGEQSLAELVDWAENALVEGGFAPESDTFLLRDIVAYLAAADSSAFPLTWEQCKLFMGQLGSPVRVVTA